MDTFPNHAPGDVSSQPAETSSLPEPLARLLRREGLSARAVHPITARPGRRTDRAYAWQTFRVVLTDGRQVKGRILHREGIAERMRRWLPLLSADHYPRLLAAEGTASLEAWCPGAAAPAGERANVERAGAMLGTLHTLVATQEVAASDARWIAWFRRLEQCVDRLAQASHLPCADRVREQLVTGQPTSAHWGLTHGDLCLENLIVSADGLCCVDNASVAPGFLAADLARTFNRWPLAGPDREAFLEQHALHAGSVGYREHASFWQIAAALRSADWRVRERCDGIESAIAELLRQID